MKATMYVDGRKIQVIIGKDGYAVKTNLPFPVRLDVGSNRLVAVK
jgi:hypothetical protein